MQGAKHGGTIKNAEDKRQATAVGTQYHGIPAHAKAAIYDGLKQRRTQVKTEIQCVPNGHHVPTAPWERWMQVDGDVDITYLHR